MHGPPTGFTNSNSTIFRRVTNLKLQFLTYSCRFIYLTFTNTSKHGQNDEIRHSSFRSSKPHEVKSTDWDMRCILTTNINICRGENTTRRKKCQIFASAMYSSYQAGISPEGGLEVGQTLWFFQERFARKPLPNHMYFEADFKVFKMFFQYLNTIFLYFNPIWQRNLNFRPCLKYILSVVKLYFMKTKTSLINLQCILFNKYD